MPYRRLPNTDAARLRALKNALDKSERVAVSDIAFSLGLKQKIEFFLPKFEVAIKNSAMAKEQQFGNSPKFSEYAKKARLYVSHFIQVLNFCIARGEMKPAIRRYYGLDEKSSKVPSLVTEQDLLQWGEKIINGEQERLRNRDGNPIYCPSIALVKVNYENFKVQPVKAAMLPNTVRKPMPLSWNCGMKWSNAFPVCGMRRCGGINARNMAWSMYSAMGRRSASASAKRQNVLP